MARLLRPAVLSLVILGGLGFLSAALYRLPVNVELRIRNGLRDLLSVEPQVIDCQAGWLGEVQVRRLQIPAAPVIEERRIAELDGIDAYREVPDPLDAPVWLREIGGPRGAGLARLWEPGQPWVRARVRRAGLRLEGTAASADPQGMWVPEIWNFQGLVREPEPGAAAGAAAPSFFIEASVCEARIQILRHRRLEREWTLEAKDLEAAGWFSGGALALSGSLASGSPGPFKNGQFQALFHPRHGIRQARASIQGLDGLEAWLPLLPAVFADLERELRPRGAVDLEILKLRYAARDRESGGRSGPEHLEAQVRHYDSSLRVLGGAAEVRHVNGTIRIEGERIFFGALPGTPVTPPLLGSIGRSEARLSGAIGRDAAEVALHFPQVDLEAAAELPLPPWARAALAALGARGRAAAELRLRSEPAGRAPASWSIEGRLSRLSSIRTPLIDAVQAGFSGGGAGAAGELAAAIESAVLKGIGKVQGAWTIAYAPERIRLRIERLAAGEEGEISGELAFEPESGSIEGTIAGSRVPIELAGGLIEARAEQLTAVFARRPPAAAGGGAAAASPPGVLEGRFGKARLLPDRLPTLDAGSRLEGPVEFDGGRLAAAIDGEGLRFSILAVDGPQASFRFRGLLRWDGGLAGEAVLATGRNAEGLRGLALDSPPAQWPRAAGEDALFLRLTGTASQPGIRRLAAADLSPGSP